MEHPLLDEIRKLDLNTTTPLAAFETLKAWQDRLAEEAKSGKTKRRGR
jgi:hypothetical protein